MSAEQPADYQFCSSRRACYTHTQVTFAKEERIMQVRSAGTSEVSILNRILRPKLPTFSPETAQDILRWTSTRPIRIGCASYQPRLVQER